MTRQPTYIDYVFDSAHMEAYSAYQKKYERTIRESDKVLLQLVSTAVKDDLATGRRPTVLDIGCSTGNFLGHLKRALPGLSLIGGDLAKEGLERARQNPDLEGIRFDVIDVLDMRTPSAFDVVVTNATLCLFDEPTYRSALENIARSLKKGGWLISFEWHHMFDQELEIVEKSVDHPKGIALYFRGMSNTTKWHNAAGFSAPTYRPFFIPIELPKPSVPSDISTYTVSTKDGHNHSFRGALYQPWCHLTAQKI